MIESRSPARGPNVPMSIYADVGPDIGSDLTDAGYRDIPDIGTVDGPGTYYTGMIPRRRRARL